VVATKPAAPKPVAPNAKDNGPAKPAGIVNQFPEEKISDVFVTAAPEASSLAPAPAFRTEDQFVVAFGNPGMDSNMFRATGDGVAISERPESTWPLPSGFRADPQAGFTPEGYPLRIVCELDGKLMAFVPGGSVRVGSDDGPAESRPQFIAFHDPFYMDMTEVTVAQFELYRQNLREQKKRVPPAPLNASQAGDYPALGLAWGDASTYVRWAGKELPTEAEFEKAARGTDGYRHPWGNGRPVWPQPRSTSTVTAVGKFPGDLGPFGHYDLAGNAREWTADWFTPLAHQEASRLAGLKTLSNWTGPKKAAQGSQRVIKEAGPNWEVYYRSGSDMHERLPDVGFRGVLRVPPATTTAASS